MSFTPSIPETLKKIFHGNRFVIPPYQRKYSWRDEERKDLWDDIVEDLDLNHFIGTLCFMKDEDAGDIENDVYQIIDGQQRVTTLFILVNCLIEKLGDNKKKQQYSRMFIGTKEIPKLIPQGEDSTFITNLIFDFEAIDPNAIEIRSQRHLYNAKRQFKSKVLNKSQVEVENLLEYISKQINVLIFEVVDYSQAVKMFTVINDRGLQLNNLDKTKSTLMFYSTLYLESSLNADINEVFGRVFDNLDNILLKKEELKILNTIDDWDFENTFYTHHYYSSRRLYDNWDYQLGANTIFKRIKGACENKKENESDLKLFVSEYIKDFDEFAQAYSDLFNTVKTETKYQQYFQYLQFTATLFPLLVRLYQQKKLVNLFDILETAEVRVYKLKGNNPRANMYRFSSAICEEDWTVEEIHDFIANFCENFLNNYQLEANLLNPVDKKQGLVKYILHEYNKKVGGVTFSLKDYYDLQVEHIFSRGIESGIRKYGFGRQETYDLEIPRIGNLTILESKLNNNANNLHPADKEEYYLKSGLDMNHHMAGLLNEWNRELLNERNGDLTQFVQERFLTFEDE